jgi:hypothetical protein
MLQFKIKRISIESAGFVVLFCEIGKSERAFFFHCKLRYCRSMPVLVFSHVIRPVTLAARWQVSA